MQKKLLIAALMFASYISFAQDSKGNLIKDKTTACAVWYKVGFPEDSVTWSGGCKNHLAEGEGTAIGFVRGKASSEYVGYLHDGRQNGKGIFTFAGNAVRLSGNFSNGEILNLREDCLKHLHKTIVFFNRQPGLLRK